MILRYCAATTNGQVAAHITNGFFITDCFLYNSNAAGENIRALSCHQQAEKALLEFPIQLMHT